MPTLRTTSTSASTNHLLVLEWERTCRGISRFATICSKRSYDSFGICQHKTIPYSVIKMNFDRFRDILRI
jgi:hypothetical protein